MGRKKQDELGGCGCLILLAGMIGIAFVLESEITSLTGWGLKPIIAILVVLAVIFILAVLSEKFSGLTGKANPRTRYIPQNVKHEVFRSCGGRCVRCGSTKDLQYDHVTPFSKGGETAAANLQVLCRKCNLKKSNKSPLFRLRSAHNV